MLLDAEARQQKLMIEVPVAANVVIHDSSIDQSSLESTPTYQSPAFISCFGFYRGCG